MSFLISIAIVVLVSLFADHLGKVLLGKFLLHSSTYAEFIRSMKRSTYSLIAVTVAFWFIFGEVSHYFLTFSTMLLFTFARLDFRDIEEGYEKFHQEMLKRQKESEL